MAACILGPQSIVCGRLQNQVHRHIPIQSSSRHTSTEHKSTLCFLFVNFTSFINCEPSLAIWHTVSFHLRERNPIIICGPSISTADADSWINLSSPSILSTRDQPRYFSRAQSASCPKYFLANSTLLPLTAHQLHRPTIVHHHHEHFNPALRAPLSTLRVIFLSVSRDAFLKITI
jgi:hypothetical protein